jgi:cysteine-rich repeat protein
MTRFTISLVVLLFAGCIDDADVSNDGDMAKAGGGNPATGCEAGQFQRAENGDDCRCDSSGDWQCGPDVNPVCAFDENGEWRCGPTTGSSCGDGVVDPETESCDDGNDLETDGCTTHCEVASIDLCADPCDPNGTVSVVDRSARVAIEGITRIQDGPRQMAADGNTVMVVEQEDSDIDRWRVRFLERTAEGDFVEVNRFPVDARRVSLGISGDTAVVMGYGIAHIYGRDVAGVWQAQLEISTTRTFDDVAVLDGLVLIMGYGSFEWRNSLGRAQAGTSRARLFRRNAAGVWSQGPDLDQYLAEQPRIFGGNQVFPHSGRCALAPIGRGMLFLAGKAYGITNDDTYELVHDFGFVIRSARGRTVATAPDNVELYTFEGQWEHTQTLNSPSLAQRRYNTADYQLGIKTDLSANRLAVAYTYSEQGQDIRTEIDAYTLGTDGEWVHTHQIDLENETILQTATQYSVETVPQIVLTGDLLLIEHWLTEESTQILEADLSPKPICTETGTCVCLNGASGALCDE